MPQRRFPPPIKGKTPPVPPKQPRRKLSKAELREKSSNRIPCLARLPDNQRKVALGGWQNEFELKLMLRKKVPSNHYRHDDQNPKDRIIGGSHRAEPHSSHSSKLAHAACSLMTNPSGRSSLIVREKRLD
jgi:hypothetical protein